MSSTAISQKVIKTIGPLGFPWKTQDPFLFCVYHSDKFPVGDAQMRPAKYELKGRNIGNDFSYKDGWSMYHGKEIPGFPSHPHRGFETVTVLRDGVVDHFDSTGSTGRFSKGDTEWMTAGKGVVHGEMMPLVHSDKPNPLELFQIWLNLPRKSKMSEPHFEMFWRESMPIFTYDGGVIVNPIAGADLLYNNNNTTTNTNASDKKQLPSPPPNSYAFDPSNRVAIWMISLPPSSSWNLPVDADVNRSLYFYKGSSIVIDETELQKPSTVTLNSASNCILKNNGKDDVELLLLQGKPIGEPVASRGPFVMNSQSELQQAYIDYQNTQFGGWPWKSDAPVHPKSQGRFAKRSNGKVEYPPTSTQNTHTEL